jgi:hypothetical protein
MSNPYDCLKYSLTPYALRRGASLLKTIYFFQTSSIYGDPAHLNSNFYNVRGAQDDVSWGGGVTTLNYPLHRPF